MQNSAHKIDHVRHSIYVQNANTANVNVCLFKGIYTAAFMKYEKFQVQLFLKGGACFQGRSDPFKVFTLLLSIVPMERKNQMSPMAYL